MGVMKSKQKQETKQKVTTRDGEYSKQNGQEEDEKDP